ncbi:MAG: 2-oxoacid:acceptor oxidoreductase family protein [Candidatus Shikimatogenerans sp. JK-2022]|nr:2-oxoacid:acceptor oxidoreductase family protein [Candidatus Shikimatogenerans bostrichidophilus]
MKIYKNVINITFSGFSGEGIQFMGKFFCFLLFKNNYFLKTFNEIPTEIYSPKKDYYDISNFIIKFSYKKIISFEKKIDILIITNYLSFKKNKNNLSKNCIIIINNNEKKIFNKIKLYLKKKKKKYILLKIKNFFNYKLINKFNLKNFFLIKKIKNLFIIGILLLIFNLKKKYIDYFLKKKIKNKNIYKINYFFLNKGYYYFKKKYKIKIISKKKKKLKNKQLINGNKALVLGLINAMLKYNIKIFYSSYPITPATNIFNYFNEKKKKYNIKLFKSEDEISSICASIGASFTGRIGIIATSGPGMSLIQESIGLSVILELPLIIINVQRVGPSTGIPTKLEQSDLMQAIYGRHGEAPLPVFSLSSIEKTLKIVIYAFKISIEFMTPVIILSDIYISNNLCVCDLLKIKKLKKINFFKKKLNFIKKNKSFFKRNKYYSRPWFIPGYNYKKKYLNEHCIGSLEKNYYNNNLSYNNKNHEKMVKIRQKKINYILNKYKNKFLLINGYKKGKILIISWGSTYDIINDSINYLIKKKYKLCFLHIECIYPLQYKKINKLIKNFKKIIIFELNNKQLFYIIKSYCKINKNINFYNKIQGIPFTKKEIIINIINNY